MSIAALNWAWQQDCPNATAKLVLLALADRADEDGKCWPGMATVAQMAGVTPRSVSTHLAALEDGGMLTRHRQRRADGTLGRYTYRLCVAQEKHTSGGKQTANEAGYDANESQEKDASGGPVGPVEADDQRKQTTSGSATSQPPEAERHNHRKQASALKATTSEPKGNPHSGRRPRDEVFDSVVEVCGIEPDALTKSGRGRVNRAVKELREIGATPEGIRARADVYRAKWPEVELTATALAANYGQLNQRPRSKPPPHERGTSVGPVVGSVDDDARRKEAEALFARLTGESV